MFVRVMVLYPYRLCHSRYRLALTVRCASGYTTSRVRCAAALDEDKFAPSLSPCAQSFSRNTRFFNFFAFVVILFPVEAGPISSIKLCPQNLIYVTANRDSAFARIRSFLSHGRRPIMLAHSSSFFLLQPRFMCSWLMLSLHPDRDIAPEYDGSNAIRRMTPVQIARYHSRHIMYDSDVFCEKLQISKWTHALESVRGCQTEETLVGAPLFIQVSPIPITL